MAPSRVLIVDDDENLQPLLGYLLESEGYVADIAGSGQEMHALLQKGQPDLVVLDLNLPDESGLALARQLRARSDVPIIVLTGSHDRNDLMAALELGVDDFITKPFEPRELGLRVRNVLARSAPNSNNRSDVVRFGQWSLDFAGRALFTSDGAEVALTPSEFNILAALVRAPGRALSRDQLLDAISQSADAPLPRMIDVHISQLRKKIETDAKSPRLIVTVKGTGYKFAGALER